MVNISNRSTTPIAAQMHLSVEQPCDLTSVLLAACRTAGSEIKKLEPHVSDELHTLAERLRSEEQDLAPTSYARPQAS